MSEHPPYVINPEAVGDPDQTPMVRIPASLLAAVPEAPPQSTYTPTKTYEIRDYYKWARSEGDDVEADIAEVEFDSWLATVTPNPDDLRQVEVVATELPCTQYCDTLHDGACTCRPEREGYARAVLAALAEAGER